MHSKTSNHRNKPNSYLFPNEQRIVYQHPLRLTNVEIKQDLYKTAKSIEYDEALLAKKVALQELMKKSLPKGLTTLKLNLCQNGNNAVMLWAKVQCDDNNHQSLRVTEVQLQQLAEPLQTLGARYGKATNCWLLLLPGFENLDQNLLTTTYSNSLALNWTRASSNFESISAIHLPPLDYNIQLRKKTVDVRAQSRQTAKAVGTQQLPSQLLPPSAPSDSLNMTDVIKQISTIQDDQERVLAASRLNVGKPVDGGRYAMHELQGQLMYYLLLDYIKRQQCRHITFNQIEADRCLHPSLRFDTDHVMQDTGCPSEQVLIIDGLNPGIKAVIGKCIEAAEKTLREERVFIGNNGQLFTDGIYRVFGVGAALTIKLDNSHLENLDQGSAYSGMSSK